MHESSAKGANQRDQTIWEGEVAGEKAVGEAVGCEARKRALGWKRTAARRAVLCRALADRGTGREAARQEQRQSRQAGVCAEVCVECGMWVCCGRCEKGSGEASWREKGRHKAVRLARVVCEKGSKRCEKEAVG
jgi:hypothetical protein